ncbi:iron complex transport system permease protein [Halobacillus karajensis]|uniref:Iron-uptake system permease protein FeuB n=1 Tax=Halobacillus karajensis TaxID=195088 RepID=A0A024P992_9BACI|nr:ABC transporter permease [Halobacillus karajensis]CDQ20939.1 Iron-uptake system permease protein FeuB [Halobacillus karajensis]CDQ24997.1 Iron-uptake system permease protein FeuB [Halobacillus karajensis]CDQ28642.1 Iron-uptake system permease protein FeuB [Halobacillus karajensis]SEH98314.1 iron complex transport system permease protein [Halobacillus karajensis]
MKRRYLVVVVCLLSVFSLFIGVSELSLFHVHMWDEQQWHVFWVSRIPRLISILIAGMSMAIGGLIMQQLSRNKFVSPTTAGTIDSARLGIVISLIFFSSASPLVQTGISFLFALGGTMIFMQILDKIKLKDAIFIPLIGIMLGNVISSITTFLAYRYDLIQSMSSWLQGDFSMILKGDYELLYISVPLVVLAYVFAHRFTIAGMGEDFSKNLGLNHKQVVYIGLFIVALMTAVVVLTVGAIPFLGLIVPNIVSIYRGDNLRNSLGHTALLGALFVLFCDILGRVIIYPYEIPIGLTVGVIGSGLFIYLLLRRKAYAASN